MIRSRQVVVQLLSQVRLFETSWTVISQAPLSMEFSRQEYWSGLPFPSPGNFLHPGANGGRSPETIKMWAMYKSSGELIKMQDFQKLGKLATARSHL